MQSNQALSAIPDATFLCLSTKRRGRNILPFFLMWTEMLTKATPKKLKMHVIFTRKLISDLGFRN